MPGHGGGHSHGSEYRFHETGEAGAADPSMTLDKALAFLDIGEVARHYLEFDYAGYFGDWRVVVSLVYIAAQAAWNLYRAWKPASNSSHGGLSVSSMDMSILSGGGGGSGQSDPTSDTKWWVVMQKFCGVMVVNFLLLAGVERRRRVVLTTAFFAMLIKEVILMVRFRWKKKTSTHHLYKERLGLKYIDVQGTFQDLGLSFLRSLLVFGTQTMLVIYYLSELAVKVKMEGDAYVFWVSAIPVQLMTMDQMGTDWDVEEAFWEYVTQHLKPDRLTLQRSDTGERCRPPERSELWVRCIFSKISHAVYFRLIAYTLPLQLMASSTGMDFVKDTFAIVFIPGLDYYSEVRRYKVVVGSTET